MESEHGAVESGKIEEVVGVLEVMVHAVQLAGDILIRAEAVLVAADEGRRLVVLADGNGD